MKIRFVLFTWALVAPAAAAAQSAQTQTDPNEITARNRITLAKNAPDPAASSGIVSPTAKFTFAAGPDAKQAKVQLGVQKGAFTAGVSMTGKLSEEGDTTLLGLNGLPADTSGSASIAYMKWNPTVDFGRVMAVCKVFTSRRLAVQTLHIVGDQMLTAAQIGRWTVNMPGATGQVTWEFDDGVKDYGVLTASHAFEKPGVHQVKVSVTRENLLDPDRGKPATPTKMVTSVRSWLVAVSAKPGLAVTGLGIRQTPPPAGVAPPMAIGRKVPFDIDGPPSIEAIVDFGQGTKSTAALGSTGPLRVFGEYAEPGDYTLTVGIKGPGVDQFSVASSPVRILDDCSYSAMLETDPELAEAHAIAVNWSAPFIVSAVYERGRSAFKFVDKTTGAPQDAETRDPKSLTGTVGTIVQNGTAFALSVSRSWKYKAGKSTELCTPFQATTFTRCDTVTLGGPTEETSTVVSLSLQKVFSDHFGIQPRLTWVNKAAALEVPIYVLQNATGGLNGGVNVGWTKEVGYNAFVFVGVLSDLFGRK